MSEPIVNHWKPEWTSGYIRDLEARVAQLEGLIERVYYDPSLVHTFLIGNAPQESQWRKDAAAALTQEEPDE